MKSARFSGAFLSGAFHAPLLQPLNGFVAHFLCHQPLAKLTGMEEFTFLVSEGTPLARRISVGRDPTLRFRRWIRRSLSPSSTIE